MKIAIVSGCAFACAVLANHAPPIGAVFTDTVTPRRFATAPVSGMELVKTVSATGVLKVTDSIEVGSQLSGHVARLLVDFNDKVKQGQVLAQLEQRDFRAKAEAADAAVESAKANQRRAQASVARAKIAVEQAGMDSEVLQARLQAATSS